MARYFSPYPLTDIEEDLAVLSTSGTQQPKIPGVQKTTARSHGRTSDLLAGGLGRSFAGPEKAMLWVCQQCFKYMADGALYDLHVVCFFLFLLWGAALNGECSGIARSILHLGK